MKNKLMFGFASLVVALVAVGLSGCMLFMAKGGKDNASSGGSEQWTIFESEIVGITWKYLDDEGYAHDFVFESTRLLTGDVSGTWEITATEDGGTMLCVTIDEVTNSYVDWMIGEYTGEWKEYGYMLRLDKDDHDTYITLLKI